MTNFTFKSQQWPINNGGIPWVSSAATRFIHLKVHQNQTNGLSNFEILTFNKYPHEEHLSNVWTLVPKDPSALRFSHNHSHGVSKITWDIFWQMDTVSFWRRKKKISLAVTHLTFPMTVVIMLLIYKFIGSWICIWTSVSVINMELICIF